MRLLATALAATAILGCGAGSDTPTGGDLILVVVTPTNPQVQVGFQVQLTAVVAGPPGIPQGVVWEARNETIATVTNGGVVAGITEGEAIIRVKWATDIREFTDVAVVVTTTPVGEGRATTVRTSRK